MQAPILHICRGQRLWLTAYRSVYWEEKRTLILSDLHLGKSGHFRKAGIAVPAGVFRQDLQRLLVLIQHFQPTTLLVTGDFFHSHGNIELELFSRWRENFNHTDIHLVKGNHDILSQKWYETQGITCCEHREETPFSFVHDPAELKQRQNKNYPMTGHIHPGILLSGMGKQHLRLPCYYFGNDFAILPAYSRFTGVSLLTPTAGDQIFAIAGEQVFKVQ